jgi:hypothetical protein
LSPSVCCARTVTQSSLVARKITRITVQAISKIVEERAGYVGFLFVGAHAETKRTNCVFCAKTRDVLSTHDYSKNAHTFGASFLLYSVRDSRSYIRSSNVPFVPSVGVHYISYIILFGIPFSLSSLFSLTPPTRITNSFDGFTKNAITANTHIHHDNTGTRTSAAKSHRTLINATIHINCQ